MISKTIIFNFFLLINVFAYDEEIQFSHLNVEDGLSLNAVTEIIQDSKGFLWFGTFHGLNRYDGYNFKIFLPEASNPFSISNHAVWALYEDSKGSIWIGTLNGLNRYDSKTGKIYKYFNDPKDPNSLSDNYVYDVCEDKSGNLWVATHNGLSKFNREKNNFTSIKKVYNRFNPSDNNSVLCIEEDYKGDLWLGTWDGVTCLRKDGSQLYFELPSQNNPNSVDYNYITTIKEDNYKNLWIGTLGKGLYQYNIPTGKFTNYSTIAGNVHSISDNFVNQIYIDRMENIWVGTKNGLNKFDCKRNIFTRYMHDENNPNSISDNEILSIAEDRTGIIWVGTLSGGLNSFPQSSYKFSYFKDNGKTINSIVTNRIYSVFLDKQNNLWIGTKKGLKEIKAGARPEDENYQSVDYSKVVGSNNSLSDNYVRAILVDHTGLVWIGTDVGGLNCYDPANGKFTVYRFNDNDPKSISNNGVISIIEDHKGNIWVGTWWGVNLFDRKTGKFTRFTENNESNTIWAMHEDSRGLIWCGTDGSGLRVYDPVKKTWKFYLPDTINKKSFTAARVFTISESKDGVLWFGSTEGLNCYDYRSGKFKSYNKDDGLPTNTINDVIEDDKGYLWISTDKGIAKFDRKTGKFKHYSKRNGIKTLEFNPGTAAKLKDGTLIFGGNIGLLYFNPDNLEGDALDVPVAFTDFKIFNQSVPVNDDGVLKELIQSSQSITIPPGNDMITFEFALLDYFNAKRNTFRYKLAGFDEEWNEVGTRNTATYTNLPPGQYMFVVRASNESGVENEKEASIRVIILPHYFQTWQFNVAVLIFIILVIIVVYRTRTRVIKIQNKILENKVAQRTIDLDKTIRDLNMEIASKDKFFSIIAHDLRSPFTGLLGLLKYLAEDADDISNEELKSISESMLQSAEVTYGLLENLLNWARIKTGRINFEPEVFNLKVLTDEIIELFKDNAAHKGICINNNIDRETYVYADINMINTVLRNLISNAIKFTNKDGMINISTSSEFNFLKVIVADTGVGIDDDILNKLFQIDENISLPGTANEKGSGLGLILCKEFVELNKGRITINSRVGEGSEFSFTLPKN